MPPYKIASTHAREEAIFLASWAQETGKRVRISLLNIEKLIEGSSLKRHQSLEASES